MAGELEKMIDSLGGWKGLKSDGGKIVRLAHFNRYNALLTVGWYCRDIGPYEGELRCALA